MSRIDDLIAKYCPNGVEMDTIGNLCKINRGRVMSKDYLAANQGDYPVYSSQTANEGMLGKIKTYDYDGEYLTWTTDGAYAGSVFYRKGKFSITNICGLLDLQSDKLLIKFLYYYLGNVTKNYVNAGMGNPKLMSNVMERIKVAVPPLAVQEEIVNILDSFTLLEAELEAELEARKKQYEHYRDKLLNIADKPGVQIMALDEVADFYYGKGNKIPNNGGDYPVYGCNGIVAYTDEYNNEDGAIIGHIGSAGIVNWGQGKHFVTYNGTICNTHKDIMLPKYAYYLLKSLHLENYVKGAQPFLSASDFNNVKVPVPSLAEQEHIVGILDKFDALVNDISDGLPAEINARRQQYEYYRDKLLNFEPIAV